MTVLVLLAFIQLGFGLDFWPITSHSHDGGIFVLYACFPEDSEWWLCLSKVTHGDKSSLSVQTRAVFRSTLHRMTEFTTLSLALNKDGIPVFASESKGRGSLLMNFCNDAGCTGIASQDIVVPDAYKEDILLLRPRVAYTTGGLPLLAFVKVFPASPKSVISLIYCTDTLCSNFSEKEITKITTPYGRGFEFQFSLDGELPRFLYTDSTLVRLTTCTTLSCTNTKETVLSNSTDPVSATSLNPGLAVVAYSDSINLQPSSLISLPVPPFQSIFLSSSADKVKTEIAIQYWDTIEGKGVVEYLHCKDISCKNNLTRKSLDVFRVSKGPWNPSISISSASGSAWLFYFKYTDKDLYAIHCPNDEIESVTSCRNYVLSNETDIIENEDQGGSSLSSLTWVWLLVTGSIIIVSLVVYLVARNVNPVMGRIEYEEVKGEDWIVNDESH